MKILIFDIETAPILADVWGLWKNNVGLNQIQRNGFIMSWCAKWLGEDYTYYMDCRDNGEEDEKGVIEGLVDLFNQADAVVAHNGDKFDMRWVRGRCLIHGIEPFAPIKQIDTLKTAKGQFYLHSNRLAYIADVLNCAPKETHLKFPGHSMWTECLKGNQEAWQEMEDYNRQDVLTLEEVYLKLRPWIKNHPNVGLYGDMEEVACPKCGGTHLNKRGFAYTSVGRYQRYQCNDCGGWARGRTTTIEKDQRKQVVSNVQ